MFCIRESYHYPTIHLSGMLVTDWHNLIDVRPEHEIEWIWVDYVLSRGSISKASLDDPLGVFCDFRLSVSSGHFDPGLNQF